MYKTLTTGQIVDALRDDSNPWSYAGAEALAEYLEDLEESTGQEMELDAVAIRCDFAEYSTAVAAIRDYCGDEMDDEEEALEYLRERTLVVEFAGGVIVQAF